MTPSGLVIFGKLLAQCVLEFESVCVDFFVPE